MLFFAPRQHYNIQLLMTPNLSNYVSNQQPTQEYQGLSGFLEGSQNFCKLRRITGHITNLPVMLSCSPTCSRHFAHTCILMLSHSTAVLWSTSRLTVGVVFMHGICDVGAIFVVDRSIAMWEEMCRRNVYWAVQGCREVEEAGRQSCSSVSLQLKLWLGPWVRGRMGGSTSCHTPVSPISSQAHKPR